MGGLPFEQAENKARVLLANSTFLIICSIAFQTYSYLHVMEYASRYGQVVSIKFIKCDEDNF